MIRILALLAIMATPAAAQVCEPDYAAVVQRLADGWHEAPVSLGRDQFGRVIVMLANVETGTWTALSVTTDGQTCMVASGGDFHLIAMPAGERM